MILTTVLAIFQFANKVNESLIKMFRHKLYLKMLRMSLCSEKFILHQNRIRTFTICGEEYIQHCQCYYAQRQFAIVKQLILTFQGICSHVRKAVLSLFLSLPPSDC